MRHCPEETIPPDTSHRRKSGVHLRPTFGCTPETLQNPPNSPNHSPRNRVLTGGTCNLTKHERWRIPLRNRHLLCFLPRSTPYTWIRREDARTIVTDCILTLRDELRIQITFDSLSGTTCHVRKRRQRCNFASRSMLRTHRICVQEVFSGSSRPIRPAL